MYCSGAGRRRAAATTMVYSMAPCSLQGFDDLGDGGLLLADGDVDADARLCRLLVDDGVDGDGGLAGLAVADDQLALAAADGDHGVDGLDARSAGAP